MIEPSPLRYSLAALAALLLAAAVPTAAQKAQAVPSDSVLRGFQRSGVRVLVVNGKEDKRAEIYLNDNIPAYLILPEALPSPILLTPRAGTVEAVSLTKVTRQKDGTVDLQADAATTPLGTFKIDGQRVTFTVEGKPVSLDPNPPLLGLKKSADLKAHSPEYVRTAQSYTPNAAALQALRKAAQPVTVRVFFGSWCPFCKEHVPMLLKVEDQLGGSSPSKIRFEYYGMPHDFKDPEWQRMGLKSVPTAIVSVNGRQVGSIMEVADWGAPEVSLAKLLGLGQPAAGK